MSKNAINKISIEESDFFQSIADTIHQVTSFPVSIWAPDQGRKTLSIVAAVGLPANYIQTASLDLSKPSVTGGAFNKNKIQIAKDIPSDPRWYYKEQAQEMNWKSAICVPIEADQKAIGVIGVYTYRERSISDLKYILPAFARQIGLTIEADKQNEVLQRILDTGEKLQSMTESLRDVLNVIVESACELTGADCAVIYPYDAEHGEFYDIQNVASYGLQEPLKLPEKPRAKGGMAAYVKRRGEVIVANVKKKGSTVTSTSSFIQREGIQAFMGVAIKGAERILGVLYVNFRTPHVYSQREKDAIRLFAHQAGNALSNASLYQRISARIGALEKLHEAGTSLTSIPTAPGDLKETLMRIAQSAKQVLGADLVEFYQYDQSRDRYDLPPIQAGEHFDKFVIKDTIHKDDVIWEIVRGKQPVYTANAQISKVLTRPFTVTRDDAPKQRFVIRENIKSSAAIPLLAGNEVVGVLFANYRSPQIFSQEQTRLIELFASQAAIAIRNTRLFQQLYEYMQLLNSQMQALHTVAQKQNIEDVLEHVLIGINTISGDKTSSSINLYDESKNYFSAYQAAGPLKDYLLQVPPRPLGSGGTGRFVVDTGAPLYLDDVRRPPDGTPTIRQESIDKGVYSFAALPLKRDNHVLGVLFVNSQKPISFTDNIKGILELFASQAAITIENARLYERLNFLVRISQIITSTIDLDAVLGRVLEEIMKALGAHFGTIQLIERTTGDLLIRAYQGKVVGEEYHRLERGKGITGKVALHGETILVNDLQDAKAKKDSGYLEYFAETSAELAVPIKVEGRTIGVLNLEHAQPNAFNENDIELLETIANQIATAIRNSTLNESLVNLGEAMVSGGRLHENKILDLIHNQAGRVMDTDNMYVALYDSDLSQPDKYDPKNPDKCKIHGVVRFGLAYVGGKPVDIEKDPSWQPRKAGKGRTEEIIRTKKPIFTASKEKSEAWYNQPEHKQYMTGEVWASWLGVPMMVGEKVIGVIATYHPKRDFVYSRDDLIALQAMANQAAILFDSSRLFYTTNLRLNALVEFGQDIITELYLGEGQILTQIHKHASNVVDTDNLYVALYDPDSSQLDEFDPKNPEKCKIHGVVTFGLAYVGGKPIDIKKDPSWQPRKAGKGRTEEIIRTRKPIFTASKDESEAWYNQPGHKEYVGETWASWLGVPMMVGEKVIGVIATYHPIRDYVYSTEDLTLLQAMASQAAVAIDSARMANNLYDANQQLEAVQRIINAVELYTDLGEFLQDILENLLVSVEAQNGTIQLYDPIREELVIWAEVGNVNNQDYQHISLDIGLTGKAAREMLPMYEPDIKGSKEYAGYFKKTRSEFAVPMLIGDTLIGVLNAEDPKKNAFNPYRRQLIERLASQLAILVRQKRQAQEAEEKKLVSQINESLGLVTAEVAHKVGNAAGKIRFLTRERLQNARNLNEQQMNDVQIILRNVEDMITATDDLFKPFGSEPKATISIKEMIKVSKNQCALPKGIKIATNIASDLPKVNVQVTKVQSYFTELIDNAIKYTQQGMKDKNKISEEINISAYLSSDDFIELLFTNHGPAIPANRWESIFRVFSATGKKLSEDDQSYGLGLWGARATMEQQGGDVVLLESNEQKTTFMVRLPPA